MTTEKDTDFNRDEIKTMMEQATLSMTGHPVKIYLRAPYVKDWCGTPFRDRDRAGRFAFEIKPDLPLSVFYEAWLHETCHLYLGHGDELPIRYIPPDLESSYSTNGPPIELSEMEKQEYKKNPKEIEAYAAAHELDHFFEHAALQRYGNSEILSRLRIAMTTQLITRREDE